MTDSPGRPPRLSHSSWTMTLGAQTFILLIACKPFPGLCACTRTGRCGASVMAIRSLYTNRADRRSQINSLDSWCATLVSKTLDVVHRYALQVSNSMTMMRNWCFMSSDVSWHIRDKLWPMPKHGSVILYVHGNRRLVKTDSPGRPPRLSHSSWTMLVTVGFVLLYVHRGEMAY